MRINEETVMALDSNFRAGQVRAVITLYDANVIKQFGVGMIARYQEIRNILTLPTCGLNFSETEADFWLEDFGVKPKETYEEQG